MPNMSEKTHMDIDIVIKNVKELQKERCCLEAKLKELRSNRACSENKIESLSQRFGQVKDVHAKMSETLKVAQHKVTHTQSQMNAQEELNTERAGVVSDCEKELSLEVEKQRAKLISFQESLENIAKRMIDASKYYSEDNLKKIIAESKRELRSNESEAVYVNKEIERLSKELHNMENGEVGYEPEVPMEKQKYVIDAATEENLSLQHFLRALNEKKEGLEKRFFELTAAS